MPPDPHILGWAPLVLAFSDLWTYQTFSPESALHTVSFLASTSILSLPKFTLYLSYDLTHLDELNSNILKMYDVQRVWHNANKV